MYVCALAGHISEDDRTGLPNCGLSRPKFIGGSLRQVCAAAPVSDPSTQRSAPIRVPLSTHDVHDEKPHKYKR